jgi:hypothetical protein
MLAFEMTSNRMRDLTKTVLHFPPDSKLAGSLGAGAPGHVLRVFFRSTAKAPRFEISMGRCVMLLLCPKLSAGRPRESGPLLSHEVP